MNKVQQSGAQRSEKESHRCEDSQQKEAFDEWIKINKR